MNSAIAGCGLLLAVLGVASAQADDIDLTEGQALYKKECSVCHGVISDSTSGDLAPATNPPRPLRVAMAAGESTLVDFPTPLSAFWSDAGTAPDRLPHPAARERLAVAPIYGPPLKGVIGREAATYKGYIYSKAFMEKMAGVIWDETKIDKWITSAQTMVPGSYMFVSIKKPDIRSKIIAYLKAQGE